MQLKHFLNKLEKMYPVELQEKWDNCGFLVGRLENEVKKVLTTLDVTHEVIEYATRNDVNLIVSHHPIILDGMKSITSKTMHGDKVLKLIENKIAVISMHTNIDKHSEGLNDFLIQKLSGTKGKFLNSDRSSDVKLIINEKELETKMENLLIKMKKSDEIYDYGIENQKLTVTLRSKDLKKSINMIQYLKEDEIQFEAFPYALGKEIGGLGNYFTIEKPLPLREYIEYVKKALDISILSVVAEDLDKIIKKVAIVSGSGGSLIKESYKKEIDLYISGDINYHVAQSAKDYGLAIVDIGHFESEVIFCELMAHKISTFFEGKVIQFGGKNPFLRM